MDGIHDLGGICGFGSLSKRRDELPFHAAWEPLPYIIAILAKRNGWWTFDAGRHSIERIPAREYISSPYFERVLIGMATLLVEHGLLTHEDIEQRAGGKGRFPIAAPIGPGHESRSRRDPFKVGDRVSVISKPQSGHVRIPGYVLGKTGTVLNVTAAVPFPGEAGHGMNAKDEPTYHVRFEGDDIWGEVKDGSAVVVDLWESYLDLAG
ncbi:nitrile hydratase subunit beta [Pseudomonas corrugata]|uniref:nitrile hydratase subunit beta n=1 Tax=Pseudomonas corrugata TaxID=47879 RepID=UPI0006D8CB72|nr:nitrile hydratase subunit beta [Pseudomonas corrugata]